jgi:hypothetical protein
MTNPSSAYSLVNGSYHVVTEHYKFDGVNITYGWDVDGIFPGYQVCSDTKQAPYISYALRQVSSFCGLKFTPANGGLAMLN